MFLWVWMRTVRPGWLSSGKPSKIPETVKGSAGDPGGEPES